MVKSFNEGVWAYRVKHGRFQLSGGYRVVLDYILESLYIRCNIQINRHMYLTWVGKCT